MNKILLLTIFLSSLFAVVHRVPHDRETIQDGITNAEPGDTVLVDDGTYYENIILNKEITLASYFLLDGDTSHRDETIIDCHPDLTGENTSCIFIRPPSSGEVISPKVIGFTIQNGVGTFATERIDTDDGVVTDSYYVGGGIMADHCTPVIKYNCLRNNGVVETADRGRITRRGGGGFLNNNDDVEFDEDRNGYYSTTQLNRDDVIVMSNNIFENNYASSGSSVSAYGFAGEVKLDSSTYDIYSNVYDDVSEYWVRSTDGTVSNVNSVGTEQAITEDVYVSPSGSNDNDGASSSPFLTVNYALSRIYGNANNPVTINLTEGVFKASETGEIFPINMVRWVSLDGADMEASVLDGEGIAKNIISIYKTQNITISNLAVTGGNGIQGGGIFISNATPTINNVRVYNNYAHSGGGIFIQESDPVLTNIYIDNNSRRGILFQHTDAYVENLNVNNNECRGSSCNGGGIGIYYSNVTIIGGDISYNDAGFVGGGFFIRNADLFLSDMLIHHNVAGLDEMAGHGGGGINMENSSPTIVNTEIYENNACVSMHSYCSGGGIRYKHGEGDPTLINVLIRNNYAYNAAGINLRYPKLINVTIVNNVAHSNYVDEGWARGNQAYVRSEAVIRNSIIWNDAGGVVLTDSWDDSINDYPGIDNVSYSTIYGGYPGTEIQTEDPGFTGNYEATSSSCIDTGDPNLWYSDEDGTRSDIGWTRGAYISTTFNNNILEPVNEFNFGSVGGLGSFVNWRLFNFRETDMVIDGVNFNTESFSTESEFPIVIGPRETAQIAIFANNTTLGSVEDFMAINSEQLADGVGLNLSVNGSELDYALTGGIPTILEANTYTVVGDIYVDEGNSSYIVPGTKFLFDGPYSFKINGTINIDGAEDDSVYFMNSDPNVSDENKWLGILLDGASSSSSINYTRITGVVRNEEVDPENIYAGYAISIRNSDPSLSNLMVDHNYANIRLYTSTPTIDNLHSIYSGRALAMQEYSFPVISNSKFNHNTGINVEIKSHSDPIFNNCEFSYNSNMDDNDGGAGVRSSSAGGVTFNNCKFQYNQQLANGSAYSIGRDYEGSVQLNNCLITNNEVHNPYNGRGGAISIFTNTAVFIRNTTIADNFTYSDNLDHELGAGISIASRLYSGPSLTYPKIALVNNIIYGNQVVFSDGSTENNQIVFSTSLIETDYEEWDGLPRGMSTLVFSHNNIQGGMDNFQWGSMDYYSPSEFIYWLDGNLDVEPAFNDDYTLSVNSPLIDQGSDILYMEPWEDPWNDDWVLMYNNWDTWGGVGIPAYMNFPDEWDQYVIAYTETSDYSGYAPDMGAYESVYTAPAADISVNPEEFLVESFTGELLSEVLTISNEEGNLPLDWELSIENQQIRINVGSFSSDNTARNYSDRHKIGNSRRNDSQIKQTGIEHEDDLKMLDEYNERKFQEMQASGRSSVASSFRELEEMLAEARDHDFVPGNGVRGDLVIYMYDSYGDGWNGNELCISNDCYGLNNGAYDEVSLTLESGTYPVTCGGGSWQSEVSWVIIDASIGLELLTGGAPFAGDLVIGDDGPPDCDDALVTVSCDGGSWQGEVSWSITGADGNEVASGGAPYIDYACLVPQTYNVYGYDSYGDGWNGNYLTVTDNVTGDIYLEFTFESGSNGNTTFTIGTPPPEISWISSDISSGTVPYGSTQEVVMTFDATELALGDYLADIVISSNDPDENPVIIPVTLSIVNQIPGCTDPEATNYNPDANIDDGTCEYSSGPSEIVVSYNTGWNIVGLPVEVEDSIYESLFLNAQSGTLYSFDGIYQSEENLEPGTGYLLRLTADDPVTFTGIPINEMAVTLSAGWNLFSGLTSSLSVEDVYAQDIIQSGTIYGLDGIYFSPGSIDPGMGYWVRATEDGEITLSSGGSAKQVSFVNRAEEANSISFSNGTYTTELYFGVEVPEEEILSYSLPPTFPEMAFDARFSGDTKVVQDSGEIKLLSDSETLTVEYDIKIDAWEHMAWVLTSETGKKIVLEDTEEITVPSSERFILKREPVIPVTFALHQNFPNPFNPITTLRYDLPLDALVTLSIYDMLGREITQLVNTTQETGFKSVNWDATDSFGKPVSAGVYIYQIQAGEFVQTKKMVLLK